METNKNTAAAHEAICRALMAGTPASAYTEAELNAAFQAGWLCCLGGRYMPSALGESRCGNTRAFDPSYA